MAEYGHRRRLWPEVWNLATHSSLASSAMTELGVADSVTRFPQFVNRNAGLFDQLGPRWRWWRVPVDLDAFVTARGVYDSAYIGRMQALSAVANAHGLKMLWILLGTPSWANAGAGRTFPYIDNSDYGAIGAHLVGLFPGSAWELWNEPDYGPSWGGTAAQYAAMCIAAYPMMKAADPSCFVIAGSLSGPTQVGHPGLAFLTNCYTAGLRGSCDAISCHPYDRPSQTQLAQGYDPRMRSSNSLMVSLIDLIAQVRTIMTIGGDAALPLWITEWGYSSDPDIAHPQPAVGSFLYTPAQQSQLGFQLLSGMLSLNNVPVIIWYRMADVSSFQDPTPGNTFNLENFFGLFAANQAPKLVVASLQSAAPARFYRRMTNPTSSARLLFDGSRRFRP